MCARRRYGVTDDQIQASWHGSNSVSGDRNVCALAAGEATTRPWLAPVGHRQPRAADIPTSTSASQQTLDQEDAYVDRKISNACRGCYLPPIVDTVAP